MHKYSIFDSAILKSNNNWILQIKKWLPSYLKVEKAFSCYQATKNGWKASIFHSCCDYKGPTLVIVKVKSYVFGGFASESWGGNTGYKRADQSFIFSLKNRDNLPPFKSKIERFKQYAMFTKEHTGATFGGGWDLHISDNANSNSGSLTHFGGSYKLPNGYYYDTEKANNLLAGSFYFTPDEVEVFFFSS
ncbi:uncharacterized protein LOC124443123 [Xenia sp. Carnegie-2017]|uniref:uncharacterized protein LOC124443123 n=1 Tax=Xenia sp. Carnegie-2017 TaxID=2897299 RepID=UPI001F04FDB3|nr:uncharacterized protein LOC124443123 [Xenia sp. Carnegie-2017]